MMKKIFGIALLAVMSCICLFGCTSGKALPEQASLDLSGYELVFADEFDGTSLDTTKWKFNPQQNNARRGAWYTDDAEHIFVRDGALVLRTDYRTGAYGEGWYTTWLESSVARLSDTVGQDYRGFASTYGYYEVSCIAPPSYGIWSAFWLMPDNAVGMTENDVLGTGADGIEIDVMESPFYNGNKSKGSAQHVLHGDGYKKTKSASSDKYAIPDMYKEFHTYGVLWTEEEYVFYIDKKETWRSKHEVDGVELGVSNVAEFMILSVEVTGELVDGKPVVKTQEWSGNPDKNDKSKAYDFVIDYVRVYQAAAERR